MTDERKRFHKLRRGFDIRLEGTAVHQLADTKLAETYAVKPTDFLSVTRPKLLVEPGDTVLAGTPLFFDKLEPTVQYCAPVSGEVADVRRGEKRRLMEVVVLADQKELRYASFPSHSAAEIATLGAETLIELLCRSGVWPHLVQRPFGIVAQPTTRPRDIFISGFDSHPLAPDLVFALSEKEDHESFSAGLLALKQLTDGAVHLSLPQDSEAALFANHPNVHYHRFRGPHPAGNVGVQIHHIRPINKGEVVWTLTPFGVTQIGRLLLQGRYDTRIRLALTGPEVIQPQYCNTYMGTSIKYLVKDNVRHEHVRYISGNVLTGERITATGYLGFHHQQVSILTEGDHREPFGWALPTTKKLSFHRGLGLLSFLFPKKTYRLDTNTHGEPRAFAQTGVFERVLPMDILPMHLIKAILAEDYEDMEALGIYEVLEEDFALCEFVDLSKHEIQAILRRGLDLIKDS